MYSLEIKDNKLLLKNLGYKVLHLDLINTHFNYSTTVWDLELGGTRPMDLLHDVTNNKLHWDRIHLTDKESFFDILLIKDGVLYRQVSNETLDLNLPFTLITGHSGGGTSVVAKSLRYLGAHTGDDSGDFSNRKTFESTSFRTWLYHFVGKNAHINKVKETYPTILSSYDYQVGKVNIVKLTNLVDNGLFNRIESIFPNIKVLSIVKPKSKTSFSREGKQFNNADEFEIYRQQHPPVKGTPIFHLDWRKYFTNYAYVNEVLEYLGMDVSLTQETFDEMLKAINFDNSKLLVK